MLVIAIDASVSGISTVSATLVTTPVYSMDVDGFGTASVEITTSSAIPAGVTGVGEALAVFAQLIEASVSGEGTASVSVKPSIALAAGVTGSGTASATVTPVAMVVAAASCEGIPSVGAWPAALVTIAATGSGTASAALTASAPISASASGEGSATAPLTAVTGPTVSAYTSGSGKDNWTVTLPSAATGDLRIIVVGLVAKSTNTISGWTKLGEDSSWYDPGASVFYRVKRPLDPDTRALDVGGYGSASTAVAMTIPGAMLPTIFATAKSYTAGAPGPHTTPAITTTKVNSLAVRAVVGNPATASAPTYSGWGSPMTELAQQQSAAADSAGDNSVMTVATGPASVVGVQPAVTVNPSIGMPYMGAAFAIEPMTIIAGMHLAAQHTLVNSGTQTQIAGWSADQGSTVISDRLVIPVTKTGAKVEVFIRYQTNSATGSPSFQWRLLKNALATQLDSVTVSGAGVGTNYEAVMTYTGNFVAGDYIYLTCAGTFVAPAPFVIPGVDTFVRVT